jgi:hypothetical protein
MTSLSQSQIYTYARQAGLSDAHAVTASAIAIAESGGDTQAHNSTPPDDSYGLWQINMLGSLGPARRAVYRLKANSDLYDPATNARVMSAISKQGQDFGPWSTYKSGVYKQFLGGVTDKGAGDGSGSSGGGGLLDDVKSVATLAYRVSDALVRTGRWVTTEKNWLRVGYVIIGGTAVLAGALAVIRSTEAGSTAIKTAKKAATVAAAV